MKSEVEKAIAEIRQAFNGHLIEVETETEGGTYVIVRDLFVGEQYSPNKIWVGFKIGFEYPYADIYPHFVEPNLQRVDGSALASGFSSAPINWQQRSAIQVSRRSNRWNPAVDSAATKLAKVLEWIKSQ